VPGRPRVEQLQGVEAIAAALHAGRALGLVLVREDCADAPVVALLELARERGVPVRGASASVLRRMTSTSAPAEVLALVGRDPGAGLDAVLAERGALWLLVGVAYPTNAGVAIRTAEGSGAQGIAIDAEWDHEAKRAATRASMRADWYMPVLWERAPLVLERARAAGHRLVAVENTGTLAPWDVDLTGPCVFMIGGEANGIPGALMERCDAVVRVPMAGFIPSYNLQIAVGVVATERLRQEQAAR
jgi:tRNA G18 (ribose-2'-O)-methylase SpoU